MRGNFGLKVQNSPKLTQVQMSRVNREKVYWVPNLLGEGVTDHDVLATF